MLFRIFDRWAARRQAKDIGRFVQGLQAADAEELGGVVALAMEWSEKIRDEFGWDVFKPQELVMEHPESTFALSSLIGKLQRQGQQILASGLMVWVHTLRASSRHELRMNGREIWANLSRAFEHAPGASVELYFATKVSCRLHRLGEFPVGFRPKPM